MPRLPQVRNEAELRGHSDGVTNVLWHPSHPDKLASIAGSEKSMRWVLPCAVLDRRGRLHAVEGTPAAEAGKQAAGAAHSPQASVQLVPNKVPRPAPRPWAGFGTRGRAKTPPQ